MYLYFIMLLWLFYLNCLIASVTEEESLKSLKSLKALKWVSKFRKIFVANFLKQLDGGEIFSFLLNHVFKTKTHHLFV